MSICVASQIGRCVQWTWTESTAMGLHSQTNIHSMRSGSGAVSGLGFLPVCCLLLAGLTAAVPELLCSRSAPSTGCLWGWRFQPSSALQLARGVCWSHLSHGAASTARGAVGRQHPAHCLCCGFLAASRAVLCKRGCIHCGEMLLGQATRRVGSVHAEGVCAAGC